MGRQRGSHCLLGDFKLSPGVFRFVVLRYNWLPASVWNLGGAAKFEPVSDGGDLDHDEEVISGLIISGCNAALGFQAAEAGPDIIALAVQHAVMVDFDPAV